MINIFIKKCQQPFLKQFSKEGKLMFDRSNVFISAVDRFADFLLKSFNTDLISPCNAFLKHMEFQGLGYVVSCPLDPKRAKMTFFVYSDKKMLPSNDIKGGGSFSDDLKKDRFHLSSWVSLIAAWTAFVSLVVTFFGIIVVAAFYFIDNLSQLLQLREDMHSIKKKFGIK
ncbi:hypothetical protein ACQ4LE_002133 [Meloidogyne hapla]